MRIFDINNRLTDDDCAMATKENQNRSIEDYIMFNMYPTAVCDSGNDTKLTQFMAENPNLRYRDGYGYAFDCTIDNDSKMRTDPNTVTHYRERQSLCSRWDQGVPNFGKGGLVPNVESTLKFGQDTSYIRDCDRLAEKPLDVFIPFNTCGLINPDVVPPFSNGIAAGVSTRDFVRNDDYAKRCGLMPRQIVASDFQ